MSTRVGVELSPTACCIVVLERGSASARAAVETRVQSFHVLPPSGADTHAMLASLRRHPMGVVAWGVASDHVQVVVNRGRYEHMRSEAVAAARAAGRELDDVVTDVALAGPRVRNRTRGPVVLTAAAASDLASVLHPLAAAGVRPRGVVTPAAALASLARLRQATVQPGVIEVYVALEESATCVALIRDGALLSARQHGWGYLDSPSPPDESEGRKAIAAKLADEISTFFTLTGADKQTVEHVCICGGMPNLRTMTVPLMEQLDLEVETLDSLFGIDLMQLPEPAEEFRERAAQLRLAWAAAADWPPPINLLRPEQAQARRRSLARAAVAAGIAAGVGVGLSIERSVTFRAPFQSSVQPGAGTVSGPSRQPATEAPKAASPALVRPAPSASPPDPAPTSVQRDSAPTSVQRDVAATSVPRGPTPMSAPRSSAPASPASREPTPAPPVSREPAQVRPVSRDPAIAQVTPPERGPVAALPPPRQLPAPPPIATTTPPPRAIAPQPAAAPQLPKLVEPRSALSARQATRAPRAVEAPTPFDAVLDTILYAPDRQLAVVDGRIVQVGDLVRGARVVDITPTTVLLRDAEGRARQLAMRPPGT